MYLDYLFKLKKKISSIELLDKNMLSWGTQTEKRSRWNLELQICGTNENFISFHCKRWWHRGTKKIFLRKLSWQTSWKKKSLENQYGVFQLSLQILSVILKILKKTFHICCRKNLIRLAHLKLPQNAKCFMIIYIEWMKIEKRW